MNRSYKKAPTIQGLLIVGLMIFGAYQVYAAFDSKDWPEVTGKITGYEIESTYYLRRYGSRYQYRPVVHYIYLVDHVSHEGELRLDSFYSRTDAINYAGSAYHKGSHLQVFYNPKNPSYSTLTRSVI